MPKEKKTTKILTKKLKEDNNFVCKVNLSFSKNLKDLSFDDCSSIVEDLKKFKDSHNQEIKTKKLNQTLIK